MNDFFKKLTPTDMIAAITIIGGIIMKMNGADGLVGTLLMAICFYYFGKQGQLRKGEYEQNQKIGGRD